MYKFSSRSLLERPFQSNRNLEPSIGSMTAYSPFLHSRREAGIPVDQISIPLVILLEEVTKGLDSFTTDEPMQVREGCFESCADVRQCARRLRNFLEPCARRLSNILESSFFYKKERRPSQGIHSKLQLKPRKKLHDFPYSQSSVLLQCFSAYENIS